MNPEDHPHVGSYSFEFGHHAPTGWQRRSFYIKAGDSPDFWKLRLLMPGAEMQGLIYVVFEDTGSIGKLTDEEPCYALIRAGRTVFKIELFAKTRGQFEQQCREIGALQYTMSGLSRWFRIRCVLRWFWERRPVVRWRSPLERFG